MSHYPQISVVTPCLNRVDFIVEAIESVLAQDYPYVEHIVVDGGSIDGTLDVLAAYPHLKIISEPDQGMYDALNKGVRLAQGDLINSLNSDDVYQPGILHQVARCFMENPGVEAIFGDATVFQTDPETGSRQTLEVIRNHRGKSFNFTAFQIGFQINACFIRRDLYAEVGEYDSRYKIVADLDMLLRLALRRTTMVHIGAAYEAGLHTHPMKPHSIGAREQGSGKKSPIQNPKSKIQNGFIGEYVCHMRTHPGSLTLNGNMPALCRRLSEEIQIWHAWLTQVKLPPTGRRYCRQQCGNAAFTLALWRAKQRRWPEALGWAWQGWRLAPAQMAYRSLELIQK